MKLLLLLQASFFFSFGTCQTVLFFQTDESSVADLPCCQGDFVLSCQQINLNAAVLGQQELDITPLHQTVKFIEMVGDSDHSYHYGNDDLEMVVTYHAEKEALYGQVSDESTGDSYVIEFCGNKTHVLKKLDVSSMGGNMGVDTVEVEGEKSGAMDVHDDSVEDKTTIVTYSVKVYYTPQFRASTADIEGFIDQVIQVTNQGYINSQVPIRVKLHCSELATLNDFWKPDYILDQFKRMKGTPKALRGTADAAALLVNKLHGACGIGYLDTIKSGNTVSVTAKECAIGTYTFGHELGHNLGLGHNRQQGINQYYADGHGYLIRRGYGKKGYRSIMAYPANGYWAIANYYSNPSVRYPRTGTVTGVWGVANNARILTANRFAAAAVGDESNKCGVITVDCSVSNGYKYFEWKWVGNMSPARCVTKCMEDDTCIGWANHNTKTWCFLYQAKKVDHSGWTTGPDLSKYECNLDTASCQNRNTVLVVKKSYKTSSTSSASACHAACKRDGKCIQWDWGKEDRTCHMHSGTYRSDADYTSGPRFC